MSETLNGTYGKMQPFVSGEEILLAINGGQRDGKVNGTTHKVGYLVTESDETVPDLALATCGDRIAGIILRPDRQPADPSAGVQWDADDALDDNSDFVYADLASCQGAVAKLPWQGQTGALVVERGDIMVLGTAGQIKKAEFGLYGRHTFRMLVDGNLATGDDQARIIVPQDGLITDIRTSLETNGVTGQTDITIANGATDVNTTAIAHAHDDADGTVESGTIANGSVSAGDILAVDIDAVPSGTTSTDLTVLITIDFGQKVGRANEEKTGHATNLKWLDVKIEQ